LLSNFVRTPPTAALVGALVLVLAVLPAILCAVSVLVACVAFPALLGGVELVALGAFAFAQVYAVLCFMALLATLPTSGVTLLPGHFGMRHVVSKRVIIGHNCYGTTSVTSWKWLSSALTQCYDKEYL
jgi:hypothetical protein